MRNRALKIGVTLLALASLPSCATDPADEADDGSDRAAGAGASDVERAEASTRSEDGRGSVIIDDVITPLPACGFNYLSYYRGWSYYGFRNCSAVDTLRRQVVKGQGGTGPCIVLPPGASARDIVHDSIVGEQSC